MNLSLFDAILRKTKESGRKTWWSASWSELLIIKIDDYWGYEIGHIDVMQQRSMGTFSCAWLHAHAPWSQATKFNIERFNYYC